MDGWLRFAFVLALLVIIGYLLGLLLPACVSLDVPAARPAVTRTVHRDVLSIARIHRESLPMENINEARSNREITAVQVRRAVGLALHRWRGTNCKGGRIQLLHAKLLPLNIIAQAEWAVGAKPNVYFGCSITFNSSRGNLTWPYYCAVISHEYGHLSGWRQRGGLDRGVHSRNPESVMYPILSSRNIPSYCKTR